jgi:hypothetical protein
MKRSLFFQIMTLISAIIDVYYVINVNIIINAMYAKSS